MKKFFIGIDVSKETLDATFIFVGELNETSYLHTENSEKGWREVLSWAKKEAKERRLKLSREEAWFCCENTGSYSTGLCEFVTRRKFDIAECHALDIKRSMGLHRSKTDKTDSKLIAEYAMRFSDRLKPYVEPSPEEKKLKALIDYRTDLVRDRVSCRNRLHSKSVLIGNKHNPGVVRCDLEKRIKALTVSIKRIEDEIEALVRSVPELKEVYDILISFNGVGLVNAITLMVRTSNFKKFGLDARRIASYYGVAPFPKESGTSVRGRTQVSRCADKNIKALLTQAAGAAVRTNAYLRQYYLRTIGKGKHRMLALNNVKNKILHILVAMVRNKTKYDPDFFKNNYQKIGIA